MSRRSLGERCEIRRGNIIYHMYTGFEHRDPTKSILFQTEGEKKTM